MLSRFRGRSVSGKKRPFPFEIHRSKLSSLTSPCTATSYQPSTIGLPVALVGGGEPTMNSKRILVAASLTHGRDAAFERGLALARASGAEMYLLHAVPANQPFSSGGSDRLERTAELRSRAEQAGVVVRNAEQHGDPAEIIELHANARAVELFVMGADRTLRSRWLRRPSIADCVLRRTTKPTL